MIKELLATVSGNGTRLSKLGLSFADGTPLPMAMVEGAGHVVRYINPAFCQLLDVPQGEILGLRFGDLVPKNDECLTLLDRVFRTGMPASHTEEEHSTTHPLFWSYTMWQVMTDKRSHGIMIQVTETAELREKTLAMNEALILGAVRPRYQNVEQARCRMRHAVRPEHIPASTTPRAICRRCPGLTIFFRIPPPGPGF